MRVLTYDILDGCGIQIYKYAKEYPIRIGLTGGHFQVLHSGHLELFRQSKEYCNFLIVAVNSNECSVRKSGYSFLPLKERMEIISELRSVDLVIENPFDTMDEIIKRIRPEVYLKGGDVNRYSLSLREKDACDEVQTRIVYNVGGPKTASSSEFLDNYYKYRFSRSEK